MRRRTVSMDELNSKKGEHCLFIRMSQPTPNVQIPQSVDDVVQWASSRSGGFYSLFLVVALLLWLGTGVYIVQPGEEGVVQTFGRFTGITTSGLNYHLPRPIQQVQVVDVASIRQALRLGSVRQTPGAQSWARRSC